MDVFSLIQTEYQLSILIFATAFYTVLIGSVAKSRYAKQSYNPKLDSQFVSFLLKLCLGLGLLFYAEWKLFQKYDANTVGTISSVCIVLGGLCATVIFVAIKSLRKET